MTTPGNPTSCAPTPPELEPLVISCQANQPADPQLWDGNFLSISLFGTDDFLANNTKNITCSLQRIATFIKWRSLGNKTGNDIPQITEFGFAAWNLITAIYKSRWNKLLADNNSRSFHQCIAAQFNKNNNPLPKATKMSPTTISKILSLLPLDLA